MDYFGGERLGIPEPVVRDELENFERAADGWNGTLTRSFLSELAKARYADLISRRRRILFGSS